MFIAFRIEREWCEITAFDDWKMIQYLMKVFFCVCVCFFSPTAECYGVFAQYRFRCVLGELGRFWAGTGFREPVPGNRVPDPRDCQGSGFRRLRARGFEGFGVRWVRRVRFYSRGLDGTGSGTRGPRTGGVKKVPGSRDSDPKVPKVTLYFESILLYFESVIL